MQIPTEITFHELERSEAVETVVHRWVERCSLVCDRLARCEVTIDQPHRHHLHGRGFSVTVVLHAPGTQGAVAHAIDEDVYLAVAVAFRAARRQVDTRLARRRGFVKRHSLAH